MPDSRRRLLKLGLGGAALLAIAGTSAWLWTPALREQRLTAAARQAQGAIARALLDGSLAEDEAALTRQLDAFEAVIANFPAAVRQELDLLLSLALNAPGRLGLTGTSTALHQLSRAELQHKLEGMRQSPLPLRQQAYFALRDLHSAAFFAEPAHWAAIGYPGPQTL